MSRRFCFPAASFRSLSLPALGALLLSASAAAQPLSRGALSLQEVAGQAEIQADTQVWRPFSGQSVLSTALRTGTGRAVLGGAGGTVTVGSASRLRAYSGETDFQEGQFYLEGEVGAFALGRHLALEDRGRARVDLRPGGGRAAVLAGKLRLSGGGRQITLLPGQQVNLNTWQVSAFREADPWYAAKFAGIGAATVQAVRGPVSVLDGKQDTQEARVGVVLDQNDALVTGQAAWAEVGFTGGGYLRLSELSELKVLAVEKTARGREVTLQLTRGSAWNVVQKGQGGYRLDTPVVSTAVRGTRFRVDASGLVKVMEGQVALPGSGDLTVSAGQQKDLNAPPQPLQIDDLDRANAALDARRAQLPTLKVSDFRPWASGVSFTARTLPDTTLSAVLTGSEGQHVPLTLSGDPQGGTYALRADPNLPEGKYAVALQASRFGQTLGWQGHLTVDRTPPKITKLQAKAAGRVLVVSGRAEDQSPRLTFTLLTAQGKRVAHSGGPFRFLLPRPQTPGGQLEVTDEAGNRTNVALP